MPPRFRLAPVSVAAPQTRQWTRDGLEAWCTAHGLEVDRYVDEAGYHIAIMSGAPNPPKGPQCHAPGAAHALVIRWGEFPVKDWWDE